MTDREQPPDRQLEQEVESLYRALGFATEPQVVVAGKRVDLLASRFQQGFGMLRLHVEVKHSAKRSLPKSEVEQFVVTAQMLHQGGDVSGSVLVTNAELTAMSRQAADSKPYIELKTLNQLRDELLAVDLGLHRIIDDYERSDINHVYVDLGIHRLDHVSKGQRVSDLIGLASDSSEAALVLLADFGAGKSTALSQLEYRLAMGRVADPNALVPFFVELQRLEDFTSIDAFLVDAYRRRFEVTLPQERLRAFIDAGRLFLLFDGFDEITLKGGPARRSQLLAELAPLLLSKCPAVLTSRLSYFASHTELMSALQAAQGRVAWPGAHKGDDFGQRVGQASRGIANQLPWIKFSTQSVDIPAFLPYELELLDDAGIDTYLEGMRPKLDERGIGSSQELREFIESIYDLRDLMRRPFQLALIVATVLEGGISLRHQTNHLGQAGLYEIYVGLKSSREEHKSQSRREHLTSDDRTRFAERCAVRAHRADSIELAADEVAEVARELFGDATDEVLTDLRTCSFLTLREDTSMHFAHRSFQEFFLASVIDRQVRDRKPLLLDETVSPETLDFVGSYALHDQVRYADLEACLSAATPGSLRRNNLATALVSARETVRNVDLDVTEVHGPRRRYATFEGVSIRDSAFNDVRTTQLQIRDCVPSDVTWSLTGDCEEVHVERSPGTLRFVGACRSIAVSGSRDVGLTLESPGRVNLSVDDSTVTLDGAQFSRLTCDASVVVGRQGLGEIVKASRSVIEVAHEGSRHLAVEVIDSVLVVAGGDRGVLAGRVERSTVRLTPTRNAKDQSPGALDISDSVVWSPIGARPDATNWTVQNVVLIGSPLAGVALDDPRLCGIVLIPPSSSTKPTDDPDGEVRCEQHGNLLVITGTGPAYKRAEAAFAKWSDGRVRGRQHLSSSDLISALTPHCPGRQLGSAKQSIDDVLALVRQHRHPGEMPRE